MRRGEDDGDIIRLCEGIGGGAQSQDLDAFVFVLVGDMHVPAEDAQHFFLDPWLRDQFPELIEIIGKETIQPAAADRLHMLVADDHGRQIRL